MAAKGPATKECGGCGHIFIARVPYGAVLVEEAAAAPLPPIFTPEAGVGEGAISLHVPPFHSGSLI